jgi:SNF2 family DNA or RNA helicase
MITKQAISKYLARPRIDNSIWKRKKRAELDQAMRRLSVKPPIWFKLQRAQKVCFLLGAQYQKFLFLADTGVGKTFLSIALARYFRKAGTVESVLVLVPRRANKHAWAKQVEKHSPKTTIEVLEGSSKHKWQQLEKQSLLFVDTYAGFVRMLCVKVQNRKGKNKLKPDRKLVKRIIGRFDGLIMDESTAVKNPRALPYRICRQLAKRVPIVFGLTGTPFGTDPSDIWSQMYLIDNGTTLGETLGLFRAAFFNSVQNQWGGYDHTFNQRKKKLLHTFLQNRSIRYKANQADLPAVNRIPRVIDLPEDANAYYQKARDALIAARGNYQECKNTFLRMRQISSGFLGYKDDDTGTRAQYAFANNPKLDMLMADLESIAPTSKSVVYVEYTYSIDRIAAELKKAGIAFVAVDGRTKDPAKALSVFDDDDNIRVCILQNSMVMGLNLQVAQYGIFYESPVSAIMRKQAERRVERQHSKYKSVFLIDMICKGTVDEQILEFHASGEDLLKTIVEGIAT